MGKFIVIVVLSLVFVFQAEAKSSTGDVKVALDCRRPKDYFEALQCMNEKGVIYKVVINEGIQLPPNAKYRFGKLTKCDSKSSDKVFNKCLSEFLTDNPQSLAVTSGCWQEIDEQKFRECWGWSKPKTTHLQTIPPKVEGGNATN